MVRCDHITQQRQYFCIVYVGNLAGVFAHALEVGRVLDVGRCRWPIIGLGFGDANALPFFVAFEYVRIFRLERFASDRLLDQFRDFLRRGPDVFQVNVFAIRSLRDWISCEVDIHRTRNRIRHNEGWRGEVVRAHIWADTAFKVAVSGQNRCCNEIALMDGFAQIFLKRARVTDAGRATITNKVKAKRV